MRYIVLLSLLLLFGCIEPQASDTNLTEAPVLGNASPLSEQVENQTADVNQTTEQNETSIPTAPTLVPVYNRSADFGDFVAVNYTLWVEGEVIDTNNATLAKEAGIYNSFRDYKPLEFELAPDKGMIQGFVFNVVGMKVNETLSFSVDPERGYGQYDPTKIIKISRYYNKSFYETIPRSYFEEQGITNISNGTSFQTPYGDVFIDDFNDENVTIVYVFIAGKRFIMNGIPQIINATNNDLVATIEYDLELNQTYNLPHPQTGAPTYFHIINKTDDEITLDSNHYLAGKTLNFQVTLLSIMEQQ